MAALRLVNTRGGLATTTTTTTTDTAPPSTGQSSHRMCTFHDKVADHGLDFRLRGTAIHLCGILVALVALVVLGLLLGYCCWSALRSAARKAQAGGRAQTGAGPGGGPVGGTGSGPLARPGAAKADASLASCNERNRIWWCSRRSRNANNSRGRGFSGCALGYLQPYRGSASSQDNEATSLGPAETMMLRVSLLGLLVYRFGRGLPPSYEELFGRGIQCPYLIARTVQHLLDMPPPSYEEAHRRRSEVTIVELDNEGLELAIPAADLQPYPLLNLQRVQNQPAPVNSISILIESDEDMRESQV